MAGPQRSGSDDDEAQDDLETHVESGAKPATPQPSKAHEDDRATIFESGTPGSAPASLPPARETEVPTAEIGDIRAVRTMAGAEAGAPSMGSADDDDRATLASGDLAPASSAQGARHLDEDEATLASGAPGDRSRGPAERHLDEDEATLASGAPGSPPPSATERRLDEDEATLASGAPSVPKVKTIAPRERPGGARADLTTGPGANGPRGTQADPGAFSASARSQGHVPHSQQSRGTARDPIGGSGAARETRPSSRPVPMTLQAGALLADRYELVKMLGKGGMGEVWQARHTLLKGMRAIKVIKANISRDPSFRERFLAEGQTMMRVKHPGVAEVTDLDETRQNRELFMVMEYLEGRTVHAAVRDETAPIGNDVRDMARILRELALGMQRIHDELIIHKDLKTDNVLLVRGEDGLEHPKVIDFGLAKRMDAGGTAKSEHKLGAGEESAAPGGSGDVQLGAAVSASPRAADGDTRTTLSGTLAYMAPEQFRGEPSSAQSDIYAFGVIMFEAFMRGEYPMPRGSLTEYVDRHKSGVVPKRLRQARPDLAPSIADLADRCMAPDKHSRPVSFTDVARDLQWWLDEPLRAAKRRRVLLLAGAAVFLVSVAVWGLLSSETTVALANPRLASNNVVRKIADDGAIHLGGDDLARLSFEASVGKGDLKTPTFAIDGNATPLALVVKDGICRAETLDISSLPDGRHTLRFSVSGDKSPTSLDVVVDRAAPRIESVRLADREGNITNVASTDLVVTLAEPAVGITEVLARRGAAEIPASRVEGNDRAWKIAGASKGDGVNRIEVFARDLAGNLSGALEFTFTLDTVAPKITIESADVVDGKLQVRRTDGNRVRVITNEAVSLSLNGAAPIPLLAGAPVELQIPPLASSAFEGTLVATDAAGNKSTQVLPVRVVDDTLRVLATDGRPQLPTKASDDVVIVLERSYPLPAASDVRVMMAQLRDSKGADQPLAAREWPNARVDRDATNLRLARVTIPAASLPAAGEYNVSVAGAEPTRVDSLRLVIDPDRPTIGAVVVRDGQDRDVAPGSYSLTRSVTVSVDVSDLSLATLTLGTSQPAERVSQAGRNYTFKMDCEREGSNSWTLVAKDAAGNSSEETVTVHADWTDPVLSLTSPRSLDSLGDNVNVEFVGTCSESEFRLVIDGHRDGGTSLGQLSQQETTAAFNAAWQLKAGRQDLRVAAVDRAGRRSVEIPITLDITHVALELPDAITWSHGVDADMRKVVEGDVVIEGRTQPVSLVYLDRTEVTNAQYRKFLAACESSGAAKTPWDHAKQPAGWRHTPPKETFADPKWSADDLPVVNVAYWDAYAFAKWSGRRLPTEAEWVKAAAKSKDRSELDLRRWPPFAGSDWKDNVLVVSDGRQLTAPVTALVSEDQSPAGCLHMGGNVSEWVELRFVPTGERDTGVRGGNWSLSRVAADVRGTPTKRYDPSERWPTIGFRCAVDAENVKP